MEPALFKKFSSLAYDKAGIVLSDQKESLVSARVAKRIRILGLDSPRQYYKFLKDDHTGEELISFLDVISTNFTFFFREQDHFDILTKQVKEWISQGKKKITIWCAASSSGEEPYSIAMTVLDALDGRPCDFRLLATDISTNMLVKARQGIYEAKQVGNMPRFQKLKYFYRTGKEGDESTIYEIKPEIKKYVTFKRLNLAKPPYPMNGPLDMIMCRNVMIYFDNRIRQGIVDESQRLLNPNSMLIIGHSETLTGISGRFKIVRPSVYIKQ